MANSTIPVKYAYGLFDSYKFNGIWYINNNINQMSTVGDNIKNGSSVPAYIDKIRRGIDATSSYTRQGYKVRPCYYRTSSYNTQNKIEGFRRESIIPYLPSITYTESDVTLDASNRLKRKLREFTGQSNQLTNVAELRDLPKTIRSVAGSATKLVTTVLDSKRRGADLRKFASDQWLTWSFGVLPTLSAVDDAVKSVNDYVARRDHQIREYGIHEKKWTSQNFQQTTGANNAYSLFTSTFEHVLSCKITAGYRYSLKSAENYNLGEHLGFSINSVIPTAWELLPYSWLIDYFTTTGSFLEDTFSADFGQSIYLCQNVIYRIQGKCTWQPKPMFSTVSCYDSFTIPGEFEYFKFTRTPLANLPRAPLRFKTQDEIAHHAVNKLLNLTALLGSKR